MQRARLLILPIKAPFASIRSPISHLSHPKLPWAVLGNHKPLKTWMTAFNPKVQISLPNSRWSIIVREFHHHIQKFSSPGSKFTISGIFSLSVVAGSISLWPRIGYSTDGFEFVVDDDQMDSLHSGEDRHALLTLLRHQATRQHPFTYKFKPFHANKVEVEDYLFLCLARVELKDQKYTLLGILGSWWVLPQSSWQEAFFTLMNRAL